MTKQEKQYREWRKTLNLPPPADQKEYSPLRYTKEWKDYLKKLHDLHPHI